MRIVLLAVVCALGCAGLVFTSVGCGSGGAAAPTGGSTGFVGRYVLFGLQAEEIPALDLWSRWGLYTSDGLGNVGGIAGGNQLGTIVPPVVTPDFTYTVNPDRSMVWEDTAAPGVDVFAGGLSANDQLAVLASVETGSDPKMMILMREGGTYSAASLVGDYHIAGWTYDLPGSENSSHFGFATFDGVDSGTYFAPGNVEGALPAAAVLDFDYFVDPDGQIRIDFAGGWTWFGVIHAGGELVLATGAIDTGDFPALHAMVKESTTATNATFTGDYFLAGMQHEYGAPAFISLAGKASADGAGNLSVTFTENREGTVTTSGPDTATYDVDPDGEVILTTGGGDEFIGGVTPSGNVVILGGPNTGLADPAFFFLIR